MARIKSINKKNINKERLYNLAVEGDESYIANDIVVHNCRSTLIPITQFEEFKEDTSVGGTVKTKGGNEIRIKKRSIDEHIKENIGEGFSRK